MPVQLSNGANRVKAAFAKGTVSHQSPDGSASIDKAAQNLMRLRKRPLLVLFYPPRAKLMEIDADDVYQAFRSGGITVEKGQLSLDVFISSYGGNPVAAYRIAQLIRDFSKDVTFLVADHAYSAATLICFSGNEVRLAHCAGLSPIDATLVSDSGLRPRQEVELASIDGFLEFSNAARKKAEELLQKLGRDCPCSIDSDLLVSMVEEVGALQVGKYYRARTLTGHYAGQLLKSYMFNGCLDKNDKCTTVVQNFLFSAPTHDFHLDYHFCQDWGILAKEMPTNESDLAKQLLKACMVTAKSKKICPHLSNTVRMPFVRFYNHKKNSNGRT